MKAGQAFLVIRYCAQKVWRPIAGAGATLLAPIGFREILLFGGTALVGYGASFIYPPAAYIAPGIVLLYVAVFGVK